MIKIAQKQSCCGCYACANSCPNKCINMITDTEGFWYPKVNENLCTNCGICEKACPILTKSSIDNTPVAYACINKDEKIRLESSSGGMFSVLAENVISNNGVVFGTCFDKEFNVVHSFVETKEELGEFRGSKYVQSKIGNTYKQTKEFLKQGRLVLFTGTPCQIGGLKAFLQQDYDNLLCIDIICHGVPSPKVWQKYVSYREKCAGAPARRIAFRRKDEGWKRYSVSFLFNNDTEYRQTLDSDLYMKAFLKDICLRPSCYACEFKTLHRQSDITLADFWGIQSVLPEMDDDKGTSLVLVNSEKGQALFNIIRDNITSQAVDIGEAIKYNPAAIKSAGYNSKRDGFFEELDKQSFNQLVKKYCTDSVCVQYKRYIRSLLSKIKRRLLNVIIRRK